MENNHIKNLKTISDFLTEEHIEFELEEETTKIPYNDSKGENKEIVLKTPIFKIKNRTDGFFELRYIISKDFRIDYHKRWGDNFWGISQNYFCEISQAKAKENIRVIWFKDYEMDECKNVIGPDGILRENYHRKWEVLKSYILTASGHIKHKLFGRDCEVRVVPTTGVLNEATPFLETYCFYGNRAATVTLGLYLKRDRGAFKAGTLLMLTSYGLNFYGNRKKAETDIMTEVIRVGTICNVQVMGGASKILAHFINNYPILTVNRKGSKIDVPVKKLVFYVDADHNDGRSMQSVGYNYESWNTNGGFHNFAVNDINIPGLKVTGGQAFQRKPLIHKEIMKLMENGDVISIGHAGTIVYSIDRDEYYKKINKIVD